MIVVVNRIPWLAARGGMAFIVQLGSNGTQGKPFCHGRLHCRQQILKSLAGYLEGELALDQIGNLLRAN